MKFGSAKLIGVFAAVTLGASIAAVHPSMAQDATYTPEFNGAGDLLLPENGLWREWVYVGTPVTPNALNGGEAPFPEVHSVYIDPESWRHWKETGTFREGTILAKELSLVLSENADENGATTQASGTGYFMSELQGLEITIKSAELFPDEPGNWVYYTFGHQPEPYQPTAVQQPAENCNACHEALAAEDFVFTQFYPVLGVSKPE